MRKITFSFTILFTWLLLFSLAFVSPVLAQSGDTLSLSLRKDMGFSDMGGGRIQGTFSMTASGPANLSKVVFYIDGQAMGEVTQAPFKIQFFTDRYPAGQHMLSAKGTTSDGRQLTSNEIKTQFLTSSEASSATAKIVIPLLGGVLLIVLVSTLGPLLLRKGKNLELAPGTERKYGLRGGTICPRCSRPFVLNTFGLNLFTGQLVRCPFCGKWFVAHRVPIERLRAAEKAELADAITSEQIPEETEEEKLRREINNSRYTG
jgi:hypothetical protein